MKYTKEELERLIIDENKSYSLIGKLYNVSGNAIKKAALKLNIVLPKRRKIAPNENFSHPKRKSYSLVNSVDDNVFKEMVETSYNWIELGKKLGYKSKTLSSNVRN